MALPRFLHLLIFLLSLGLWSDARAHDPGLSGLAITIQPDRVEAVATFARGDIQAILGAEPDRENLLRLAPEVLALTAFGRGWPPSAVQVDPRVKDNDVEFRLTYPTSGGAGTVALRSTLIPRLAPGHRQYLAVHDAAGRLQTERLLRAEANSAEFALAPSAGEPAPATFAGFLAMGVEHILTGYDHLLFLGALLLVARTFGTSLKIISCFTLGHSITLALATMNVVNFPGLIVEPLIAASIIYVGAENLFRRGEPRGRYLLTFAFGLVHGLGFAGALREMGVGGDGRGIAMPLLGFNLGVELGQLSVAAVVLPIFWVLQENPVWLRRGVPACSAVVVLAGAFWLVERVAGLGS